MTNFYITHSMKIVYTLTFVLLLLTSCQNRDLGRAKIDYFGQQIPIAKPEIFAPGIISLQDRWEGNANFSSDGKEFYFNVFTDSMRNKAIYWCQYKDGEWSDPKTLDEIGSYNNWEPFVSYSGKELFFVSSRPPGNEKWNGRIWRSERNDDNTWRQPEHIDLKYKTKNGFWFPNHSRDNNNILYFGGNIEEHKSIGKGDLYFYDIRKDIVINIEALNSEEEDWDPFISPDGSYLLWASEREGGYGGTDIYVSFRTENNWGEPINLGEKVNSKEYEVAPRISNNGKVLFFDRPEKGSQDILWVSSSIIRDIKDKTVD